MDKEVGRISEGLTKKLYDDIYKGDKRIALGLVDEAELTEYTISSVYSRKYYGKKYFENEYYDDHLVLNSIVDIASNIDERKYMLANVSYSLSSNEWKEEINNPEDGKECYILLRIYNDTPMYREDSDEIYIEIATRKACAKGTPNRMVL